MEGLIQAVLAIAKNMTFFKPAGSVNIFAGATVPVGWLECDGSSLLRADYPDLYAAIGTVYGTADSTHFNIPDLRGLVVVGQKSTDTSFDTLGETGGEKTHLNTSAESGVPGHTHGAATTTAGGVSMSPYTITSGTWVGASPENKNALNIMSNAAANAASAHNNLQPYMALKYIIKL